MSVILVLDFGGTKQTAAVLASGSRAWLLRKRALLSAGADATEDLESMLTLAHEVLADKRPASVGVSFGGPVDSASGLVRLSHHVPGWENIPLAGLLAEEFEAPTAIENDANVAALGEYRFGAGRGFASLLFVTVSTGVGGGWILNGELWRGADGMAGEIGHTVADPAGPRCLCGKRGCVERLASGPYMAQDTIERLVREPAAGKVLRTMVDDDLQSITAKLLAKASAAGDQLATEALERGARALGKGIGNAANLVNPQRIILGGGVSKAGSGWWRAVRQTARQVALPEVLVEIVPAYLGDDAPLWGAAVRAMQAIDQDYNASSP